MNRLPKVCLASVAATGLLFWLHASIGASAPLIPTNIWVPTGDMAMIRAGASATLLADGTVLVAGGVSDVGFTASVERYNVLGGAFMVAAPMQSARANHSATALGDG